MAANQQNMVANPTEAVGLLGDILKNAQRMFYSAVARSGAPALAKDKAAAVAVEKILATKGALPTPENLRVPNKDPLAGQNAEGNGKTILEYLSNGLDRFLLSINICIVLLRAKDIDMATVNSALKFVRELKVLYATLCASVEGEPTNIKKVADVKAALDALLAVKIQPPLMLALQQVGEPRRATDNLFINYSLKVKADTGEAFSDIAIPRPAPLNVPEPMRKEVRVALPAPGLLPPPAPGLLPPPVGLQLPTDATPVDFGDTATMVKGKTAQFQYINIDANNYVKAAPLVIVNKDVKIYAVSYVPVGGQRMYEMVTDDKIISSGRGITVEFNNTPKENIYVKFYTNPPLKTKGGRRRTKAKAKASRKTKTKTKAKASRKTKAKATRRNRRS